MCEKGIYGLTVLYIATESALFLVKLKFTANDFVSAVVAPIYHRACLVPHSLCDYVSVSVSMGTSVSASVSFECRKPMPNACSPRLWLRLGVQHRLRLRLRLHLLLWLRLWLRLWCPLCIPVVILDFRYFNLQLWWRSFEILPSERGTQRELMYSNKSGKGNGWREREREQDMPTLQCTPIAPNLTPAMELKTQKSIYIDTYVYVVEAYIGTANE